MEQEYDEDQEENDEFKEQELEEGDASGSQENNNPDEVRRRSSKSVKEKEKGCCSCKMPKWYVNLSGKFFTICEDKTFERTIIVLILLNTAFLASEHYE